MSKIRVLADHLANQIAAGEVVERPASVVKELLENALDAGADRINIQVQGDGTRLIRVMDNGFGMDQDDVLLSLERHATSKLLEESQLTAITTLGFRGEALPSIASVSRMSLLSRLQTAEIGTRAEVRYGTLHDLHDDGCACGTLIEVRNLFGNLPARKKFLKSKRTELFHIEEVIRNQALAHPDITFSLQVDGRKTLILLAAGQEQRVRDVFRYSGTVLDVFSENEQDSLMVNGVLLLPDASSTASTTRLRILVNNRPVQDRMIRYAVADGLKGVLMKGQQPGGALMLSLDAQLIDINVHPAKREIRFRRPNEVRRFLVRAVAEAVLRHQEEKRSELFHPSQDKSRQTEGEAPLPEASLLDQEEQEKDVSGSVSCYPPVHYSGQDLKPQQAKQQTYSAEPVPFSSLLDQQDSSQKTEGQKEVGEKQPDKQGREERENQPSSQPGYNGLRLIGQLRNLYLLCEHDEQLVVIDQHAAHERILYQQLRSAYEERAVAVQNLLFPVTVELGPDHADTLEQEGEAVAALGLHVEFFGDTTWVIKGVPAMVGTMAPQEVLFDILDGLATASGASRAEAMPECVDNLLASMACKAAIKSGNQLHPEEMLALLQQMEQSSFFSHCPHGRPVLKTFSQTDMAKWFRRS
ncbi:DNA mismatch repair endonuclease MutL [Candidatus Electrothrix sp.]|uniref:DNA mismatch repair endonuclease MutL n=1 Tax=Candidatus Electrothrix sp. TaxID=2170559 RepID=UPI004057A6E7